MQHENGADSQAAAASRVEDEYWNIRAHTICKLERSTKPFVARQRRLGSADRRGDDVVVACIP
jgi:hypothetical protein